MKTAILGLAVSTILSAPLNAGTIQYSATPGNGFFNFDISFVSDSTTFYGFVIYDLFSTKDGQTSRLAGGTVRTFVNDVLVQTTDNTDGAFLGFSGTVVRSVDEDDFIFVDATRFLSVGDTLRFVGSEAVPNVPVPSLSNARTFEARVIIAPTIPVSSNSIEVAAIPIPAGLPLMATALGAIALLTRRARGAKAASAPT